MTAVEKIKTVKTMLGDTTEIMDYSDEMLATYLKIAGERICARAYPFQYESVVPEKYCMLQCELAVVLISKRGAEGETSHSENGITRQYSSESELLNRVVPYVAVI